MLNMNMFPGLAGADLDKRLMDNSPPARKARLPRISGPPFPCYYLSVRRKSLSSKPLCGMKKLEILLAILLLSSPAYAHRDRILTLRDDGSIAEIPASLGPVFFRFEHLDENDPKIEFQVAEQRTTLPACLTRFVRSRELSDTKLTGSWYHDESNLPYYVNIKFIDPGQDPQQLSLSGYNLLFNLRNAQLIKVSRFDSDGAGGGMYTALLLDENCKKLLPGLSE